MQYEVERHSSPFGRTFPPIVTCQCQHAPGCGWGTGASTRSREMTAYAEAVERDTIFALKEDFVGKYLDNEDFVSPVRFGYPEAGDKEVEWVRFQSEAGRPVYLHRPTRHSNRPRVYHHTSNGVAVHVTRQQAFQSAYLEVLERHWIVEFWERRAMPVRVTAPDSRLVIQVAKAGWIASFFMICQQPFVAICVLQANEALPPPRSGGVCFGAKAHADPKSACVGAFSEALQLAEGVSSPIGFAALSESTLSFFNGARRDHLLERLSLVRPHLATLDVTPPIEPARIYRRELEFEEFYYCEVQIAGLNSYPPSRMEGGYRLPL
ncbi:YcaO-like family protein [Burkholderia ubonensis]|uniref:YcaO-like family protein n=1 Tax=Burkholderia ubonensis TaxID=101571 RepID=UPI0009B38CDF|nr:YcaO-like family protein [Burkholderia ubonensis]